MFDARRSTICDKSIGIKDDIIENILIIITFSCVEAILVGWLYCWGFCSTEAASVTKPTASPRSPLLPTLLARPSCSTPSKQDSNRSLTCQVKETVWLVRKVTTGCSDMQSREGMWIWCTHHEFMVVGHSWPWWEEEAACSCCSTALYPPDAPLWNSPHSLLCARDYDWGLDVPYQHLINTVLSDG